MGKRKSVDTKVAVLLPTRGRAAQMKERVGDLLHRRQPAKTRLTVYLAIQKSDQETLGAAAELPTNRVVIVEREDDTTAVEGWNAAYEQAAADGADWYVLGADDLIWHQGWLTAALKAGKDAHVVGLADGYTTDLDDRATHIMVSSWFCENVLKGFIPAVYSSWSFDREMCKRAQALGVYATAPDALLEHMHPAVGKAEMDETYRIASPLHARDHATVTERLAAGFPDDAKAVKK